MIAALARSLVRHRRRWTAGAALILAASLALGSRLTLRHEAADFLPRGQSAPDTISVAGLPVTSGDRIVVVLESGQAISAAEAGPILDTLVARLSRIAEVRQVDHRLSPELQHALETRAPPYLLLYLPPAQLVSLGERLSKQAISNALLASPPDPGALRFTLRTRADPLGVLGPVASVLSRARGTARLRLTDGYFSVASRRAFLLTLEPAGSLGGIASARSLVGQIETVMRGIANDPVLRPALTGKRLYAVGRPVAVVRAYQIARADALRVGVWSSIAVFLLLLLAYRRLQAPFILVGTVFFGLAVTGAIAFLVFQSVSLVGWLFVAVLVGLGVDFGVYIATHYWVTAEPGATRADALASAMRRPARGVVFGGLTTAAAFFSLVTLQYPVMTQLAWLTTLGLLAILASSFTILPLALSYTAPERKPTSVWYRFAAIVHQVGGRGHRWWWLGWVLLVGGSLWAARTIPFEPHPWKVALRGNPSTRELEQLRRMLGTSLTPLLMVSTAASVDDAVARDREATLALERIARRAGIATIQSLSHWLPDARQQRSNTEYVKANAGLFSPERFRRDFLDVVRRMVNPDSSLTAEYLPLISRFLNPNPTELTLDDLRRWGLEDMVDRHLQRRGEEYRVISYVYLTRDPWAEGVIDRLNEAIGQAGDGPLTRVTFLGDALLGARHASTLRQGIILATSLALVLVLALLFYEFRRPSLILLCLLPLVCCVSAGLGLMALLGVELNVLTLAIAPLLVGISVDDGIHMVERLNQGETTLQALQEAGSSMTVTTLAEVSGFACLGLATFGGVREVGLIGAVGMIIALVAAVQLVPMGYRLVQKGAMARGKAPE